jgi:hypothetical protein
MAGKAITVFQATQPWLEHKEPQNKTFNLSGKKKKKKKNSEKLQEMICLSLFYRLRYNKNA